jgi:hypothetical protein
MMFDKPRVEGTPGGVEAPKPATPAQGVPAPAPVPPAQLVPADVPAQPSDAEAEWNARQAKLEAKWKRDMDNLRSSLDSSHARDKAQWERERQDLTARLESDLVSRMTPEERSAYEVETRQEREQRLQEELENERSARQALYSMLNYAQRLQGMGVNLKGLDFSDPNSFFREADARFEDYINDLQAKATGNPAPAAPAPASPAAPVPARPTPPQVVTATGTPPAQMTPNEAFEQLRKLYSEKAGRQLSEEEVWRLFETGQQDLNKMIPGLSTP